MRAAEATGNHEAALEWDDRMQRFRKDRHERRVDMIEVPVRVLLALPKIALGLFLVLATMGVFLGIAMKHIAEVAAPFEVVAHIVGWAVIAFSVSWGPVLLALPWIGLGALWWTGRAHANANMTGWLAPPKDDDDTGLVITADTIVAGAPEPRQDPGARGGRSRTAGGRRSTPCPSATDAGTRQSSASPSASQPR